MHSNFTVFSGSQIYRLGAPIVIVALKVVPEAHAILAEWYLFVISTRNQVVARRFGRTPLQLNREEIDLGVGIDERLAKEGAGAKAAATLDILQEEEYARSHDIATLAPVRLQEEENPEWFLQKIWIRGVLGSELVETRDATRCPALKDVLRKVVAIRQFFTVDDPDADVG
jgi:hypothetical protein